MLDRARANPTPLLLLPKLDMIVAWTSVPLLELRLKELIIDGPRLAIRRHRSGVLRIAGLEFDPAEAGEDLPISDWILRQREIVIRDALIIWDDDLRNAPQLVLDRVQFRLESRFGHHRFGLKGTPPAELAAPLDIRGDLQLDSLKDWQNATGKLFVRLDYADVAAWREWLPLPGQIATGTGALRVWVDFARQEATEIVADVELADVKATLAANLPEIELAHLSGRVATRKTGAQREFTTSALAFTTRSGERLDPTNVIAELARRAGRQRRIRPHRVRSNADRPARLAERPSAAARADPGRPRPLRSARNALERPAALGGNGKCPESPSRQRPNSRSWGCSRRMTFPASRV